MDWHHLARCGYTRKTPAQPPRAHAPATRPNIGTLAAKTGGTSK